MVFNWLYPSLFSYELEIGQLWIGFVLIVLLCLLICLKVFHRMIHKTNQLFYQSSSCLSWQMVELFAESRLIDEFSQMLYMWYVRNDVIEHLPLDLWSNCSNLAIQWSLTYTCFFLLGLFFSSLARRSRHNIWYRRAHWGIVVKAIAQKKFLSGCLPKSISLAGRYFLKSLHSLIRGKTFLTEYSSKFELKLNSRISDFVYTDF